MSVESLHESEPNFLTPIIIGLAVAWSGQLGFDAIVFFLTLWRSITIGRSNHQALITTLFRDGEPSTIVYIKGPLNLPLDAQLGAFYFG